MDGSPPAYHLDRGFGTGINSWLIQLEVLFCFFLLLCSAFDYSRMLISISLSPLSVTGLIYWDLVIVILNDLGRRMV